MDSDVLYMQVSYMYFGYVDSHLVAVVIELTTKTNQFPQH